MADTDLIRRILDSQMSEQDKIVAIRAIKAGTPQGGAQPASAPTPAAQPEAAVSSPSAAPAPQNASIIPDQAPPAEGMPQQPQQGMLGNLWQQAQDFMGGNLGGTEYDQRSPEPGNQLTDMAAPTAGELTGNIMGAPLGPLGSIAGGAIGSMAGLYAGRKATGRDVTAGEMLLEGGLSVLPEALEAPGRRLISYLVKGTKPQQRVARDTLHAMASDIGKAAFDPPTKEKAGELFELVRKSGVKIKTDGRINSQILSFNDRDMELLRPLIDDIGSRADQATGPRLGRRVSALLDTARKGTPGVEFDLGDLDKIRSSLSKQISYEGQPTQRQELAIRMIEMIDRGIDEALDAGGPNAATGKLLKEARDKWHRYRAEEDLSTLTAQLSNWDKIHLDFQSIDLARLKKALTTPEGTLQEQVARSLDTIPGAREEINKSLARMGSTLKNIEVDVPKGMNMATMGAIGYGLGGPLGLAAGVAGGANSMINLPRALGTILANRMSRETLEKTAFEHNGVIPYGKFSMIFNMAVNAARRGAETELTGGDPTGRLNPRNRNNY